MMDRYVVAGMDANSVGMLLGQAVGSGCGRSTCIVVLWIVQVVQERCCYKHQGSTDSEGNNHDLRVEVEHSSDGSTGLLKI